MSKTYQYLMKCGHSANSEHILADGSREPACVICAPKPEAYQKADEQPDLSSRTAKCAYCKAEQKSSITLAFFEHKPNKPHDEYYCGCRGWD